MTETNNVFRLKVDDRVVTVNWDVAQLRGEVLDTIEDYLGVSVYAWLKRWENALLEGVRLTEFRSREIIALVYLGMFQADPDTTLQHVARSVAPYAIEFLPQDKPAPRTMQGPPPAEPLVASLPAPPVAVDPDGHRNVPPAFLAPTTASPVGAALGAVAAPDLPQP